MTKSAMKTAEDKVVDGIIRTALAADHPYKIGQAYLFRTVTFAVSGVVDRVTSHEIVVTQAAWVADTGRFNEALRTGEFLEVEAADDGEVIVGRGAIVDAWPIAKAPRETV